MITPVERAQEVLGPAATAPLVDALADAFADLEQEGRKYAERWTEIAIASYVKTIAFREGIDPSAREALLQLARDVEDRAWRRPEFQSGTDLASAARAAGLIPASVPPMPRK